MTMRLTTLISLLMLALPPTAAMTSSSCLLKRCTLVGYENGLSVQVSIPPMPAAYRVEVEADGDVLGVDYEVSVGRLPQCVSECRIEGDRIVLDGQGAAWDDRHLYAIVTRRGESVGPAQATVRIYRGDALVAAGSFKPRYQTDEPNGPGCGEHVFASASLDVP
jgi:hypothetical protein